MNTQDQQQIAALSSKGYRVSEVEIEGNVFTVISVESDRAKERLYDKVKRMVMESDPNTEISAISGTV